MSEENEHRIIWNWQQKDWPNFNYDPEKLKSSEEAFLLNTGVFLGAYKHINENDKTILIVDITSSEAQKTSEIEGEYLNRDSLQSSIRRNLGLASDNRKVEPSEQGIADLVTDLYDTFKEPLTNEKLLSWHKMLMKGRTDIKDIGCYRTHDEPMQIISGPYHKPRIHFEAPPSKKIKEEMEGFIRLFNATSPIGEIPLPALIRASLLHLYFESIHPFEDGNGRIGRAIAEKSLAQSIGQPSLIALSQTINSKRKTYYEMLEQSNKNNDIDSWLIYFANTILEAQSYTIKLVEFLIKKTKFYDKHKNQLNERQAKAIERIFREGLEGFKGGLSAKKYIGITSAPRSTATRDLQDLAEKGIFSKTGIGKGTRYNLILS